ncbi:TAXI family TRAP transporter solute-binding subunit [bacterium SCSIO 12827]|nr:TAXI family TRAP transporter solute-binding subunit [bacterium SCSIO 12827]
MKKLIGFVAILAVASFAMTGIASAQKANWPKSFTVATASQGGTFFQYGSGWANIISKQTSVVGSAEVTGGPVQNLALVQVGKAEFGLTTLGPAADALAGKSPAAPGVKMDKVRAIFPMYVTPFTFITLKRSGVDSFAKLPKGVRVGVGPAGGTGDAYWPGMLKQIGVDAKTRNAGWSDLAGQLKDGLVDAIAFGAGVPVPAATELEATDEINFLSFTPEQVSQIEANFPVSAYKVPSTTYKTLKANNQVINTVSMWNFAIANADLPDDFIYEVVKTTMENNPKMLNVHKAAKTTVSANAKFNKTLPWHPGALRYFKEIGAEISDNLNK